MPEKEVMERAHRDAQEGKAPSTQAGEFVREEFEHVREGKHGARSPQQAIAIGLSKARRAGVKLPPPKKGRTSQKTQRQAARDLRKGGGNARATSAKRSRDRATPEVTVRNYTPSIAHPGVKRAMSFE
jgi:transcription initiation factor TFIID subunit TAF12